jgi:hypothetical protein
MGYMGVVGVLDCGRGGGLVRDGSADPPDQPPRRRASDSAPMNTPAQIATIERIHELRAKMIKFGKWEAERAYEIQQLIKQQAMLSDEIMMLEYDLDKQKKAAPQEMLNAAERLLRGIGL